MNHANEPEWRENLADIKLNIVATDLNLQKNFNASNFAKAKANSTLAQKKK